MAVRKNDSMGFVDAVLADLGGPRSASMLERLDAATPWEQLAAPVRALPEYTNKGAGHPAWCPVLMLKCLMLQKWFGLSDPGLEEQLKDRISFRKFVGLSFTDKTPDETTVVRFRQRLREARLHDAFFQAIVDHIERQGLLVKQGTMVDATIIEAPRGKPRPDGTTTRDQDASFTRKHGIPHHGYKGHMGTDLSGVVVNYVGGADHHPAPHPVPLPAVVGHCAAGEPTRAGGQHVLETRAARGPARARCGGWHLLPAPQGPGATGAVATEMEQVGIEATGTRGAPDRDDERTTAVQTCSIPRDGTQQIRLRPDPRRLQHQEEPEPAERVRPGAPQDQSSTNPTQRPRCTVDPFAPPAKGLFRGPIRH